jgi:hypothetical protein
MIQISISSLSIKSRMATESMISLTAAAIMNRVQYCVLPQAARAQTGQLEWNAERVKMQTTLNGWPPRPEYEIFSQTTGEHKDIQFWRERETWPMFPASGPGSSGRCAS